MIHRYGENVKIDVVYVYGWEGAKMSFTEKGIQTLVDKFQNEEMWVNFGFGLLKIIAILVVAKILIRIGKIAIHNIFKFRNLSPLNTSERREETLSKLLENILSYVVYFIAIMMILTIIRD